MTVDMRERQEQYLEQSRKLTLEMVEKLESEGRL